MFRLTDLHALGVMGVAMAVNALGFFVLKRARVKALNGEPLALTSKPMTRGLVGGALLFGVGWAISGTCPGTSLVQVGEGRLAGLVTFAGILLGAWLQQRVAAARSAAPRNSKAEAGSRMAPA